MDRQSEKKRKRFIDDQVRCLAFSIVSLLFALNTFL